MTVPRTCAIVPRFDHAATVAAVARAAAEYVSRVIVVDDGSTDGGADSARAAAEDAPNGAAIEVLALPSNQGKGAAVLAGLRRAAELGFGHALVLDADAQHKASDIPRFLDAIAGDPRAIVVGARDLSPAHIPAGSRFGRAVSNFWVRRTTGYDLSDTQCGFRAYPVEAILALPLRGRRYDFEVEVLVRGAWAGLDLREVPIDVWYPAPEQRVSHFRGWADNVAISLTYTRLAARRLWPAGYRRPPSAQGESTGLRAAWRRLRALSTTWARRFTRLQWLRMASSIWRATHICMRCTTHLLYR
jgi:glycosyltransferase involved in cell wall biosynthesis